MNKPQYFNKLVFTLGLLGIMVVSAIVIASPKVYAGHHIELKKSQMAKYRCEGCKQKKMPCKPCKKKIKESQMAKYRCEGCKQKKMPCKSCKKKSEVRKSSCSSCTR